MLAAIVTGLVFVTWFNRRLGLPPRLGTLIAAGTSICGVTAIVSTAPAIDADEREVAYAVANVVAFGLFGMLVYPYLAHALLLRSETDRPVSRHRRARHLAGRRRGAHLQADVCRRRRAARRDGHQADAQHLPGGRDSAAHLDARARGQPHERAGARSIDSLDALVPGFVDRVPRDGRRALARRRDAGNRTAPPTVCGTPRAWRQLTDRIGDFWASRILLGTAMAAVGLNTSFAVFKGVGLKPFVVGLAGALVVGSVGMVMAIVFGRFVTL